MNKEKVLNLESIANEQLAFAVAEARKRKVPKTGTDKYANVLTRLSPLP